MPPEEIPALIIIDMVKDYFDTEHHYPITHLAQQIIQPLNRLIAAFHEKKFPVVFATDAFEEKDFFFTGKMHPHAIKGTPGAEVVSDLDRADGDLWLPKPRFSAFFNTDLAGILKGQGVTLCAVAGIATHFCVLATVMDSVCHEFKTVLLEDCSADFSPQAHEQCLGLYRKNPLYPLLQVLRADQLSGQPFFACHGQD
jgi:nicotinamidase-related amidase